MKWIGRLFHPEREKKTLSILEIENKGEISELGGSRYAYSGFVVPAGSREKHSLTGWVSHGGGITVYSLVKKIVEDILMGPVPK